MFLIKNSTKLLLLYQPFWLEKFVHFQHFMINFSMMHFIAIWQKMSLFRYQSSLVTSTANNCILWKLQKWLIKKKVLHFCFLFLDLTITICSRNFQNVKLRVKTAQCWNSTTCLPLRFYVKSNFGEFKQSKNVIFGTFRGSEF